MPARVEQKFFVTPDRMVLALALIRRKCRWDAAYPSEQINSLYFDTPELEQHERSLAGEFAKAKVRIRWYGAGHDPHGSAAEAVVAAPQSSPVNVWIELKERRGFASTKQRRPAEVAAAALHPHALAAGIVPLGTLLETMGEFGFFAAKRLCPVVAISYWRRRFIEPQTGFRVALDSAIRSSLVMPGVGRGERGLRLAGAVVEIKGPSGELPGRLLAMGELGSSWTRFSKYSSSLSAHAGDLGGVSRLWPSGIMSAEQWTGAPTSDREVEICGIV
jgi:hypothetical protein